MEGLLSAGTIGQRSPPLLPSALGYHWCAQHGVRSTEKTILTIHYRTRTVPPRAYLRGGRASTCHPLIPFGWTTSLGHHFRSAPYALWAATLSKPLVFSKDLVRTNLGLHIQCLRGTSTTAQSFVLWTNYLCFRLSDPTVDSILVDGPLV